MKSENSKIPQISFADALLSPQSIALIGISGDPAKNTARPLRFMRKHDYRGRIFPVNATRREIMGEPAFASVADIAEPVDHAFVMVGSDQVEAVLEQCAARGVKIVTIYSDGYGETGEAGMAKQNRLIARSRELGLRILGPNSIGIANFHNRSIISVNAVFEMDELVPGDISLVSQSGSMMGSLLSRAITRGFGFAKSVSVGNESDISVGEVIDALIDDPQTRVILLFLETIRDAQTLASALERARSVGKPVIAYKVGRSELGDALSQSHTGAIAGNDAAVNAFFQAHGVIRVNQLETLFEIAPLAVRYGQSAAAGIARARVAVITTTGGGAATVVDNLGLYGLQTATPPSTFVAHMAARGLKIRETPIIDLTLAATSAQYKDLLEQLLVSDWCDAVLSVVGSSAQFHPNLAVKPLIEAAKPATKPLAAFLSPEALDSLRLLQQHGIAAFRTPEACADGLAALFRCRPAASVNRPANPPTWPDDVPRKGNLTEYEAGRVFAHMGIPVAASAVVKPDDVIHDIPYPVVAKVSSRDILHKTEVGGVQVGIVNAEQLRARVPELVRNVAQRVPSARIEGVLIQKMESGLLELMLGYRLDPLVGPTVVLSTGGISAELLPDFSVRLAPVTETQAREMISEVRHTRLIQGFRGLPLGDCDALARVISRFSQLAYLSEPTVSEAEINPLFVQSEAVVAVDGLVRLV